jgi:hypothetical protein
MEHSFIIKKSRAKKLPMSDIRKKTHEQLFYYVGNIVCDISRISTKSASKSETESVLYRSSDKNSLNSLLNFFGSSKKRPWPQPGKITSLLLPPKCSFMYSPWDGP